MMIALLGALLLPLGSGIVYASFHAYERPEWIGILGTHLGVMMIFAGTVLVVARVAATSDVIGSLLVLEAVVVLLGTGAFMSGYMLPRRLLR